MASGPAPDPRVVDTITQVSDRLRAVRDERGLTLAEVSATTGVSTSTLSRLETGQRRPTLELLLALALAYDVPLSDLVGAPAVGDPRVRLQPREVNGRVVVPLTRHPGSPQVWKLVIAASDTTPRVRTHEGHEWLYVMTGQLRLVLGAHDVTLTAGQAAEFDTRVPHWFGSTGAVGAEILSIFGPQGERVHVRATTVRSDQRAARG
jgi:transcriptional regulator with XRE-family HTH domain